MTEETNVYDPTVSKFYEAISTFAADDLVRDGSEALAVEAIRTAFDTLWPAVPSPTDIDYLLRDFAEALDAVAATWDNINSQEEN